MRIAVTAHHSTTVCTAPEAETTTDANGAFTLPAVRTWSVFTILLGDPVYEYHLCILQNDHWREIYQDGGIPAPRVAVDTITCDLVDSVVSLQYKPSHLVPCSATSWIHYRS